VALAVVLHVALLGAFLHWHLGPALAGLSISGARFVLSTAVRGFTRYVHVTRWARDTLIDQVLCLERVSIDTTCAKEFPVPELGICC
jgi:hypothetical protein